MHPFKLRVCGLVFVSSSLSFGQVCLAADKDPSSKSGRPRVKKIEAFSPENIRPDSEVPLNPERYIWKLSTKRATLDRNSSEVPIYMFDDESHQRVAVGSTPVGEVITLDRIKLYGHRHFYGYNWNGDARGVQKKLGPSAAFWVDGMNVDYAGKK